MTYSLVDGSNVRNVEEVKIVREIKYRGLDVLTDDLVYGSHVQTGVGMHYIIPQNLIADALYKYHVDKETIGQYTGIRDKNDREIYEGDILRDFTPSIGIVKFHNGSFVLTSNYQGKDIQSLDNVDILNKNLIDDNFLEVIGNIYKNTELLRGESQ